MIHVYALMSEADGRKHLRCPDCSKEVVIGDGTYRVLTDRTGRILHGDQTALHRWARGISIDGIRVTT